MHPGKRISAVLFPKQTKTQNQQATNTVNPISVHEVRRGMAEAEGYLIPLARKYFFAH